LENPYAFEIGGLQCLAVADGSLTASAKMLFANAPEEELERVLERQGLEADRLAATWTCLFVRTATNTVLVDTGFGSGGTSGGQLLPSLRRAGIPPEDIDVVFITHVHADHVGGCVDEAGQATFPDARYFIGREEWEFWTTEANLQNLPERAAYTAREKLPPLADKINLVEGETEIVPGVRTIFAPGHTPGHMAIEVESRGEHLIALVDAALHPIQIEYPGWYSQVDQSPERTVETRKAIYRRAAKKGAFVLGFHFAPFPSLGHIVEQNGKWEWRPLPS
jgi:glyoxylase-like metal-dependent hydrolase (beta-lactamase superfamily II)